MSTQDHQTAVDRAREYTCSFLVGFIRIDSSEHNLKEYSAGSGTLVKIDQRYCIMTAAHVIDEMESYIRKGINEFGVVVFAHGNTKSRVTMRLDANDLLKIGERPFTDHGPDIGIIFLQQPLAEGLKAKCTFKDITRDFVAEIKSNKSANKKFHVCTGVIAQLTKLIEPQAEGTINIMQNAELIPGNIAVRDNENIFDYFTFSPEDDDLTRTIETYKGMSGGAIWSVFAKGTGEIADLEFVTAVPEFVMFWEKKLEDGKFSITAHGPRSIQHLVESVRARWP